MANTYRFKKVGGGFTFTQDGVPSLQSRFKINSIDVPDATGNVINISLANGPFITIVRGTDQVYSNGVLSNAASATALVEQLMAEVFFLAKKDETSVPGLLASYMATSGAFSDDAKTTTSNHYQPVRKWKDRSAGNVDLSPGTANVTPMMWKRGRQGIYFTNPHHFTRTWGLLTGAAARTIIVGFSTKDSSNSALISWGTAVSSGLSQAAVFSGGVGFTGFGNDLTTSITPYVDNLYHLMVITYDGTTMKLYIDGVLKNTGTKTLATGNSALNVGKEISGGARFLGKIHHWQVYDHALTQTELDFLHTYFPSAIPTLADGTAGTAPGALTQPVKLMIGTDIASDVDDVDAVAMACKLHKLGECELLGICANSDNNLSASTIKVITNFYSLNIPIGAFKGTVGSFYSNSTYTSTLTTQFGVTAGRATYTDGHLLYRQILAAQPDNSVVICSIGFANNLKLLIDSPADGISPLTGLELITQKVKRLVMMGGKHVMNDNAAEFNYEADPTSMAYVHSMWPTDIVSVDYIAGSTVLARPSDARNGATDPVKKATDLTHAGVDSGMWDPMAILLAVRGLGTLYNYATVPGVDLVGPTGYNRWIPEPGKMQYIGKATTDANIKAAIVALLDAAP